MTWNFKIVNWKVKSIKAQLSVLLLIWCTPFKQLIYEKATSEPEDFFKNGCCFRDRKENPFLWVIGYKYNLCILQHTFPSKNQEIDFMESHLWVKWKTSKTFWGSIWHFTPSCMADIRWRIILYLNIPV